MPTPSRSPHVHRLAGGARLLGVALLGVVGAATVPNLEAGRGRVSFTASIPAAPTASTVTPPTGGSASRALRVAAGTSADAAAVLAGGRATTGVALAPAPEWTANRRPGLPVAVVPLRTGGAGAPSSWTAVLADVDVARWDPCRPIPVRYDPTGAPWDLAPLVADRVAALARLTGLDLRMGTIGVRPDGSPYGIVVAWAAESMIRPAEAVAVTSPLAESDPIDRRRSWLVRAEVVLDARAIVPARRAPSLWAAVVTHELLHALGLGHTDDPSQVMATVTRSSLPLGAGDLTGIAQVSAVNGCRTTA